MSEAPIVQQARAVLQMIQEQEKQCHRPPGSVTLVAVSKTRSVADIQAAFEGGVVNFGESYVQEASIKQNSLKNYPIIWHFIGKIQSNKTDYLAKNFSWVQSVDRISIANQLNKSRSSCQSALNICIQVNVENEPTKSGVHISQLLTLTEQILPLKYLKLRGLMCIPKPHQEDPQQQMIFHQLKHCLQQLNHDLNLNMDTLSMGMSADICAAICAGSSMVRVGKRIFAI